MMAKERMNSKEYVENSIKELKARKAGFLEKIGKLNGRLRYKEYEKKALEPFLEQTKNVRVGPLRKALRDLETRIATQAYTPKIEKELVKEVKKIEVELAKVSEVEWARRKKMLVDGDIERARKEIAAIEPELRKIRKELDDFYEDMRSSRKEAKVMKTKGDHTLTLEEIAVFEKK